MFFSASDFKELGGKLMNRESGRSEMVFLKRFKSLCGSHWDRVADAWLLIVEYENVPRGIRPKHLLWALMHIQVYATETVLAGIAKTDKKTIENGLLQLDM